MGVGQLVALIAALTAFAGALGGIIAQIRHVNGPSHNGKP